MHDFVFKEVKNSDIETELSKIGFDKSYIHKACEKYVYKNIKIFSLTPAQANIIKQTALSVGADCATHREVITGRVEKSDCILGGSIFQLNKVADKLRFQPFGLRELGEKLIAFCNTAKSGKVHIVGILNITENSFSDGGLYNDFEKAKEHLLTLINDGADIIDIGAESTKPYSMPVEPDIQLEKLIPAVNFARGKIKISIDTRSAKVAEECIKAGAEIINDVSGLEYDKNMAEVIAKYGVKVIIQHSKGTPENMQVSPEYDNLIDEIYFDLKRRIDYAVSKGIKEENIIVDPGIGFGKTREDNFEIIRRIKEFKGLRCRVMLGVSRKSLLNMNDEDNFTKDIFTAALNTLAIESGVDYLRVHNVKMHKQLVTLLENFQK